MSRDSLKNTKKTPKNGKKNPGIPPKTVPRVVVARILDWFGREKRDLPWRKTRDPYAIWLSETMLQQTQVETVKPYYDKFLQRFPKLADLAGAELDTVLELWAGLGYYRRARNLHAAAKKMVEEHAGKVPSTVAQLLELPGVGRYTAGAVASIAYGAAAPLVDGNVARVLARVGGTTGPVDAPQVQRWLWVTAEDLVAAAARPGDFNQGLMELGATICRPVPVCQICPLAGVCAARKGGWPGDLGQKNGKRRAKKLHCLTFFALLEESFRVLVMRRPDSGKWAGMWELPTLKKPAGVNSLAQIADVLEAALGVRVDLTPGRRRVEHALSHRDIICDVYMGRCGPGAVRLPACDDGPYQEARWVERAELERMAVGRVTRKVLEVADKLATNEHKCY